MVPDPDGTRADGIARERTGRTGRGLDRRAAITTLGGSALLVGASVLGSVGERVASTIRDAGDERRNLVFVISDDHRYDFLGFLDEPSTPEFLETPHLSRMAREGVHLKNAFVTTSLCSPSRASVLTGQYAHQHGVIDNQHRLDGDVTFFPEVLQEAGYETAFVGKWHMGHANADPRPGFDRWVSFRGQGRYVDPTLNVDGKRVKRAGYVTDLLTEYATDWLREREGTDERPFCLYLSHKAVHRPFRPAPRHRGRYDGVSVPRPWETSEESASADGEERSGGQGSGEGETDEREAGKPRWVDDQRGSVHGVENVYRGQMSFEELYRRYCETLSSLDESVGTILEALREQGHAGNTLSLYMGDNGFLMGEHGLIDKRAAYEESIRIPMIVHAPGLVDLGEPGEPGDQVTDLVTNVDVAPTLLDVAGCRVPKPTSGRSFLPLLRGERRSWRDSVLYEYFQEEHFPQQPTMLALRGTRYKLVRYRWPWIRDEFYDLKADPGEHVNRIDSRRLRSQVREMDRRLFDRLRALDGTELVPWRPPRRFEPGRNRSIPNRN